MTKNQQKNIIAVVIGLAILSFIVVFYKNNNTAESQALAKAFCDSITPGKNVEEVMAAVGASSFEQLTFVDSTGQVINAANKGTFSPSKSAGFTSGTIKVGFTGGECSISVTDQIVSSSVFSLIK
ncbi:hypothetical protein [Bdellovibrio sp. HCB274]|uniref:hypothetical protein n=1 Tax=Bdellovibrio sp. HCB274 TaxID=3394361 RepID=UPI0039B47F69